MVAALLTSSETILPTYQQEFKFDEVNKLMIKYAITLYHSGREMTMAVNLLNNMCLL